MAGMNMSSNVPTPSGEQENYKHLLAEQARVLNGGNKPDEVAALKARVEQLPEDQQREFYKLAPVAAELKGAFMAKEWQSK